MLFLLSDFLPDVSVHNGYPRASYLVYDWLMHDSEPQMVSSVSQSQYSTGTWQLLYQLWTFTQPETQADYIN